ncbi:hypothetical protein GGX14DRAFT_400506 [Mycena pura]|uniref:Uncharacterized protein n=1 Tax=Mycena pura TaxID=153505 RepID=A0AAD6V5Q6_9AGAR|nr:hypothetical protein GGX14DRAFT_400506 [Mycena pura]
MRVFRNLLSLPPPTSISRDSALFFRAMLWAPSARKTRSGTVFAAWTTNAFALQAAAFDIAPLLLDAVAAECEDQDDAEPDDAEPGDALNDVDDVWPPPPLPDPWNEVDDLQPAPEHCARSTRKSPTYDHLLATGTPLSGPHRRRAASRARKIAHGGHIPRASTLSKHVAPAHPIRVPTFNATDLPSARGAYAAVVEQKIEKYGRTKRRSVAELIGLGFQLVQWDGVSARPIADTSGRIFAALAGQPDNHEWRTAVSRAYDVVKQEGAAAKFPADMRKHRRGLFAVINVGLSYGKGHKAPTQLDAKIYAPLVDRLLTNKDIARMANFASATFALWAPRLHAYYVDHNAQLTARLPHLQRPFPKSVFASAAFNFGSSVWTFKHRDVCNLPFGWCAVQSMGKFDATKGGHLILWDLKLVVEFPAGALILLPSATVAHSNVPVQVGDERTSFTQFTSGAIFRWLDHGGRTEAELEAEDPDEYARQMALKETRWEAGLGLWSTLDELLEHK